MRGARLITATALAAMVLVPAAWVLSDARGRDLAFAPGSANDRSEEGAQLAREYLAQRARARGWPGVATLHGELEHEDPPRDAVIFRIRAEPPGLQELLADIATEPPDEEQDGRHDAGASANEGRAAATRGAHVRDLAGGAAGLAFVHGGGRIVVADAAPAPGVSAMPMRADPPPRRVHPAWPLVNELRPAAPFGFEAGAIPGAHALVAAGTRGIVLRVPFGSGDIVVLACPDVLLNASLAEADHLALLEALAGEGRPVLFDEHLHGDTRARGVMELLRRAGLGPLVVIGALAAAAWGWRRGVRIGPPEDPHRERRSEAVDFVDSVALLHERALRRSETLRLYRRALEHEVVLREGLRGQRLNERVAALAGPDVADRPHRDLGEREFHQALGRLNAAFRSLDRARRIRPDHARP